MSKGGVTCLCCHAVMDRLRFHAFTARLRFQCLSCFRGPPALSMPFMFSRPGVHCLFRALPLSCTASFSPRRALRLSCTASFAQNAGGRADVDAATISVPVHCQHSAICQCPCKQSMHASGTRRCRCWCASGVLGGVLASITEGTARLRLNKLSRHITRERLLLTTLYITE